ncbi:FADS2 [Bugula neritina]|uniref:FADS2 n=1 Tax=Bugula neritina TaxID=10212 RepID=A0A7J7JGF7_BUGNE|nr:FADS2 [Bugula neritina]
MKPKYTRKEVECHADKDSKWLIIHNKVYDITNFSKKHPGGAKVISHAAGEDATDAWTAFHDRKDLVTKYMNALYIGDVEPDTDKVNEDFRQLRTSVEAMGLFKANPLFYIAHIAHIVLMYFIGCWILYSYGIGWAPYLVSTCLFVTAQIQAGWTQHDYGHLSVFTSNYANHLAHKFTIGTLKGAASHWWNFRHFQHHAKPNVIKKDPDVSVPYVFLVGETMAKRWGQLKKGFMPYKWQTYYFHLLGPPVLLPVYFHIEVLYFIFKRRDWMDLLFTFSFFTWWFTALTPVMGAWSSFKLYMLVRFLESHWFTYVTQMSHIPMAVDNEQHRGWFQQQLATSANVEPGLFNDWFTGHLNFQIEHHLFPTMPRHNLHKAAPLVQSLCRRHNIEYVCNPLLTQFANILRQLEKSGDIYYNAYWQTD